MDNLFYVVTAPIGQPLEEFLGLVRGEVGPEVASLLPDGTRVRIRQRDERFSDTLRDSPWLARVPHPSGPLPVDAVIDVSVPVLDADLDGVHLALTEATSTCQGWRVEPTVYADNLPDPPIGELSDHAGGGGMIRRPDGMTRERFSIEWHVHAIHAQAKVTEGTRGPMLRNIQNRIVEPVTPTRWVLDGYEDAAIPAELFDNFPCPPEDMTFEQTVAGPGETQYFRMPPALFFGREVVVARGEGGDGSS